MLTNKMSPPKKPEVPPYAPRSSDYSSEDPKMLASAAMVQMSREMQALGQEASAKIYMDQSSNPPPGTASRALQHVADEFQKYGDPALATKLRSIAAQIYTEPTPAQA